MAGARAHALALLQAGRWGEACEAWRQVVQADPADADGWFNLAWLQHRLGDPVQALHAYTRALAAGAEGADEIHRNRATILAEQLSRPDEAEAELAAALRLAPEDPATLLNLGNLHEQCGRRDAAREAYQRALRAAPRQPLALARLLELDPPDGLSDPRLHAVREALVRGRYTPADRADLAFALARALDRAGEWDLAFAAGLAANEASRIAAGGVRYDRELATTKLGHWLKLWERPLPQLPADGLPDPLFICGLVRSGSTLVERILAAHPAVKAGGELELIPALAQRLGGHRPDEATLLAARRAYRDRLALQFPPDAVVTDKRPDNALHLGLGRAMFGGSRIVHARRDPRDIAVSVFFLHLTPSMPWALDIADTGHWWRLQQRIVAHWSALFPGAVIDFDYEALVARGEPEVRRLLSHCGLAFNERCMRFHAQPGFVQTPSAWQVRRPLNSDSVGRWRHYERHLGPLLDLLDAG